MGIRPTHYESLHTVGICAPAVDDRFAQELRDWHGGSLSDAVGVDLHHTLPERWRATLVSFSTFGPNPESAKQSLILALRKIADELEASKVP